MMTVCYQWVIACGVWVALLGLCCGSATADIYKWVDENGVMHFTNAPTSSKYQPYIKRDFFQYEGLPYFSGKYDPLIDEAARKHRLSSPLLKAIIKAESSFNPRAVSRAGALGLMQIMPQNLKQLQISDPFDPRQNIMGGARYFRYLLNRFNGKLSLALAGYNAGPHRVDKYQGIPPFKETRNYVRRVMKYYRMLKDG